MGIIIENRLTGAVSAGQPVTLRKGCEVTLTLSPKQ